MFAIFKRELLAYFSSMTAYIVIGLFLIVSSLFVWVFPDTSVLNNGYSNLDSLFYLAPFLFIFFIPAITMRSFAEEKTNGTLELLYTRPISFWHIILGKFFACWIIVVISILPTLIYYYAVVQLGMPVGNIDGGAVFGAYIGLFLLGSIMVSIGIFSSSITQHQIIAFAISVFLCFLIFSGFEYISKIPLFQFSENLVQNLGINAHYESISRGVIDTRDLLYFISVSFFFLFLTKIFIAAKDEK